MLADTDNTAAFIPLQHLVPRNRSRELLKLFDRQLSAPGLTELHRQQYTIARKWLAEGSTATVEILEWSKGFVSPVQGESYAFVLGGIMVSAVYLVQEIEPDASTLASIEQRQCSKSRDSCDPNPPHSPFYVAHIFKRSPSTSYRRPCVLEQRTWYTSFVLRRKSIA